MSVCDVPVISSVCDAVGEGVEELLRPLIGTLQAVTLADFARRLGRK